MGNKVNLCRHLKTAAETIPEQLAVSVQKKTLSGFSYQELSFEKLHKDSDEIAFALNQFGLKAGDKAVLMVTPSIAFFTLTFALFKAGIIPILVDPGMGIKNLKQCFQESKPDAFIGIPKAHLARLLFSWAKESVKYLINVNGPALFGGEQLHKIVKRFPLSSPYQMQQLSPNELAAILFTSGSTGSPKGVVYTHTMFEAQIQALKEDYEIKTGEADLATFPLFSLFGPALGMASIVPDMDASKPIKACPKHLFAAVEKYQCSNLFANPALLEVLGSAGERTNHKLPSIKRVISAGAPATIASIKRFSKMLNPDVDILNSYGATEALPISKIASHELFKTTDITDQGGGICVGYPIDGVEINVIDIDDQPISQWQTCLSLQAFEIGEIVVKGRQVSSTYYNRLQANQIAKIQDGQHVLHRMGDLGYLDDKGKLWMCGRKAHRVQSTHLENNKVYYSIPCERIFNTHPSVKRSALVTVTINNNIAPALCIELVTKGIDRQQLFLDLNELATKFEQTQGITLFFVHPGFPMDIRHNAKIFREKLALWAQQKISKSK